jgi:hypothetical protein
MRRALATAGILACTGLAPLGGTASARTLTLRPSSCAASSCTFSLHALRGQRHRTVGAVLRLGRHRHAVRARKVRHRIRRGRITFRVHRASVRRRALLRVRLDTRRPGRPGSVRATAQGSGTVRLSWGAARDDVGIAGYRVLRRGRHGRLVRTAAPGRRVRAFVTRARPGTTWAVAAVDRAGNVSRPARATAPAPAPVTAAPAAAPATAPAAAAPAAPSFAREGVDVRMPVGDRPGWKQTFTDDFTKDVPLGSFPAAVSDKWGAYRDGWTDTTRRGVYTPSKVLSVSGGVLDYAVHTEAGVHLVAAPTPKLPNANPDFGQTYGRYAVRFRSDLLPGYKVAWLLWPDSGRWPGDGEIDFPEGDLDGRICGYVHHQEGTSPGDQDATCSGESFQGWHTAVIEWTPAYVRFVLDGVTMRVATSRLPTTSMHWVLQTETNLDGRPIADATAGHVQIDWVAAWRPA